MGLLFLFLYLFVAVTFRVQYYRDILSYNINTTPANFIDYKGHFNHIHL